MSIFKASCIHMNGIRLEVSDKERDIGVTTSDNLKPAQQCKKAAQTASAVLAQITRAFHYRDRHVFLSLYQQYVRPHLELAVAAWSPWTQADIQWSSRGPSGPSRASGPPPTRTS